MELRWRYGALIHDEEERLLHENPKQYPEPQVERVFMRLYEEKGVRVSYRRLWNAHRYFEAIRCAMFACIMVQKSFLPT